MILNSGEKLNQGIILQKTIFRGLSLIAISLSLSVDTIKVKTRAPQNQQAVFQYRVPRGYNPRKTCRVLVIFGGRNTDGKADASGRMGWGDWNDKF